MLLSLGWFAMHPAPADAHARLVASSPAAGQRIDAAVRQVSLTFDRPVDACGGIRVIDAAGAELGTGRALHRPDARETLTVPVPPLRHGQFVVTWRVISDDGLTSGAFAFGVGVPAGAVPAALAHPVEDGLSALLTILDIGAMASLLVAIGLTIAAVTLTGGVAPYAALASRAWLAVGAIAFLQFFGQADAIATPPLQLADTRYGALRIVIVLAGLLGAAAMRVSKRTKAGNC